MKRAFVFGGTGTVGSAILRELARRSVLHVLGGIVCAASGRA